MIVIVLGGLVGGILVGLPIALLRKLIERRSR